MQYCHKDLILFYKPIFHLVVDGLGEYRTCEQALKYYFSLVDRIFLLLLLLT